MLGQFKIWARQDEKDFKDQTQNGLESFSAPKLDDGAREVEVSDRESGIQSGIMQQFFGQHTPEAKSTADLINTYRSLMDNHEVDNAVSEIVNEAIVYEDGHDVVSLDLDSTEFSQAIKDRLLEEFNKVTKLLNMQRKGSDHFRRWYVDSRIFFHKVIDQTSKASTKEGIKELRRLDPRNIEFVREIITEENDGVKIVTGFKSYFIYDTGNENYCVGGRVYSAHTKIKIPRHAIVYAHSGLLDCCGKNIIGWLHRAVKPANQLKLLEDAMVIYRITRAPERRVFYIDTGNMPSRKASQHMNNIMNGLKNRVVYDASTGKIKNQQHNMSMTEDYWLQRRDGKAVTDVTSLPGATNMSDIDDVRWFNRKLYEALKIPLSRMPNDQGGIQFGGGQEITRDELNFGKFTRELLRRFEEILLDPLRTNVVLAGIMSDDEFEEEINNIKIRFHRDSYFTEMKDAEIMERRINMLTMAEPLIGKYISHQTAMKQFLQMTDEEIDAEAKLIEEESKVERFQNPDDEEEEF
ncbi:portal vertex protein [Serratia phage 4S]|nr:portal vertex protein [Serratia phage 4S]